MKTFFKNLFAISLSRLFCDKFVRFDEKNADLVVLNRGFLTKKRTNLAKIDRNWRLQTGSKNKMVLFVLKTSFYAIVLILLLYLYHFKQSGGGAFIYNEF